MNRMKKRLMGIVACAVLIVTMACSVSAAKSQWSDRITLDVPGWNHSVTTDTYVIKAVYTDDNCTFYTYKNEAWGLFGTDGSLSNSNNERRSDWVRNMREGETLRSYTWAQTGYQYYATISTDLLEPNEITVEFKYSPDNQVDQ